MDGPHEPEHPHSRANRISLALHRADAALAAGIVEPGTLRSRAAGLTADTDVIERTVSRVERLIRSGD